jgi:hypothetical protein
MNVFVGCRYGSETVIATSTLIQGYRFGYWD